jgi:hypothetical protein
LLHLKPPMFIRLAVSILLNKDLWFHYKH